MGRDKSLLEINGVTQIQRATNLLTSVVAKITLVTAATPPANSANANLYSNFGLPSLADRWPNAGPLGGIATALASAKTPWTLMLACDMPFITKEWITYLLEQVGQSQSKSDVIIPETQRGLEPLCAIYRTRCAPILAAALDREVRKVTDALAELHLKRIVENEWLRFSPDGNLFGNLNTWQDYLEAQERLKS